MQDDLIWTDLDIPQPFRWFGESSFFVLAASTGSHVRRVGIVRRADGVRQAVGMGTR